IRIYKMNIFIKNPDHAQVEHGEYAQFKKYKAERSSKHSYESLKRRTSDAIEKMKREWDAEYDGMVEQIKQGYEQAVIDANANIEAVDVRMQEELDARRK